MLDTCKNYHCVKSFCIASFSDQYFLALEMNTEIYGVLISYLVWLWENTDQKISYYGYFSQSVEDNDLSKEILSLFYSKTFGTQICLLWRWKVLEKYPCGKNFTFHLRKTSAVFIQFLEALLTKCSYFILLS